MKAWPSTFWIPLAVLVLVFLVYPCVDQAIFGLRITRAMHASCSIEQHEDFTNRMAAARDGMSVIQVTQLLGQAKALNLTNGNGSIVYEWRGVTESDWFGASLFGLHHSYSFGFRDGVLKKVDQAEGGWGSGAIR